jgi:hypothetical protein
VLDVLEIKLKETFWSQRSAADFKVSQNSSGSVISLTNVRSLCQVTYISLRWPSTRVKVIFSQKSSAFRISISGCMCLLLMSIKFIEFLFRLIRYGNSCIYAGKSDFRSVVCELKRGSSRCTGFWGFPVCSGERLTRKVPD